MKAQTRQKPAFRFRLRWEYLILVTLMALFSVKFLDKTSQIRGLNQQVAALQTDNQNLAASNVHLQHDLKYYATNQYAQNAARGLLGYTKPGETGIDVQPVAPHVTMRAAPPAHVVTVPSKPVWQQWLDVFTK